MRGLLTSPQSCSCSCCRCWTPCSAADSCSSSAPRPCQSLCSFEWARLSPSYFCPLDEREGKHRYVSARDSWLNKHVPRTAKLLKCFLHLVVFPCPIMSATPWKLISVHLSTVKCSWPVTIAAEESAAYISGAGTSLLFIKWHLFHKGHTKGVYLSPFI